VLCFAGFTGFAGRLVFILGAYFLKPNGHRIRSNGDNTTSTTKSKGREIKATTRRSTWGAGAENNASISLPIAWNGNLPTASPSFATRVPAVPSTHPVITGNVSISAHPALFMRQYPFPVVLSLMRSR